MSNKARLKTYLSKHITSLVIALLMALLFASIQLLEPFLLGKAIDASSNYNKQLFDIYIYVALGLVFLGVVCNYFFELIINNISQKIIKEVRDDLFDHINKISIKEFDTYQYGEFVQLEIRDMENFASGIFAVFKTLMQGVFTVVITIILMVMVNWILALGVFLLTPLSMLMSYIVSHFSYKHYKKQNELQAKLSSLSVESVSSLEVIQAFNYESKKLEEFKKQNEELRNISRKALFSASWVNPSTRLVNNIIYVLIGIAGIIMLFHEDTLIKIAAIMSIGRLSSFLSYTNQYSKPFNEISSVVSEYQNAKASFSRVNNFLNISFDIDEGKIEIIDIKKIEFKDVSFSYRKNQKLIEHLNLVISKGDKVAIVGPTGAGKTTLINLLMRFYEIDKGEILINDIPYQNISKSSLRKNIGMVLQDTFIFDKSIKDNIKYLKDDATEEEVIEASKKSHVYSFINEDVSSLSEGQKQMIAIARVFLLNPNLVILDEATSNIDTRSEILINEAFNKMMLEKTSIVIAHRLSTIKKADTILVVDQGEIKEVGNHASLLKKKGLYYQLYSSQYK